MDEPTVKWDVSLLGGWRYTEFDSVTAGSAEDESTAQITPGTRLEWDITEKFEYFLNYSIGIGVPVKSHRMRNIDSTQDEFSALNQTVHIITIADTKIR